MKHHRLPGRRRAHQHGVIAIMFAVILVVILGFMGMALDLSRMYNRKVELQSVADLAALAAARKLVGTQQGVDAASSAAGTAVAGFSYNYAHASVPWSDAALKFGKSPNGPWLGVNEAKASPEEVIFVRADTAALDSDMGMLETFFIQATSSSIQLSALSASAIAGRSTSDITPLAVCAMDTQPAVARSPGAELIEYGFRRGVGYDLMNLNPKGTSAENFVINPIDAVGAVGSSSNTLPAVVGPFACAGSMPVTGLMSGKISVARPFPIASLYPHLNSRFDQFSGACNFRSAPPDANIKAFTASAVSWMKVQPSVQSAASDTSSGILKTIADAPTPATSTAPLYGPLWSYARPVPFSAYTPGVDEPLAGYLPLATSAWAALYTPGLPEPKSSYPAQPPYFASGGVNFTKPSSAHGRGMRSRRVLNIPLLACPVPSGSNVQASVLAIGRFFMTVPATSTALTAEFAGIVSADNLGGAVELYK